MGKRRKTKAAKGKTAKTRPFCPPYILRYDNLNNQLCQTIWGCKYCTQFMINEESVVAHRLLCKDFIPEVVEYCTRMDELKKLNHPNRHIPVVVSDDDPPIYVCSVCQNPYRRRAAMITHERLMHQLVVDVGSKSEHDETPPVRRKRAYKRRNLVVPPLKIKTEIKEEPVQDYDDFHSFIQGTSTSSMRIKSEVETDNEMD